MRNPIILFIGVFLIFQTIGLAQSGKFELDVKERTLSNDMTVLVMENHSAPTFSTVIHFNTGSVDERPGITGISHLLEHMLFKGTKIFGTANYEAEIPLMEKIDSLAHLMIDEMVKLQSPLNPPDSAKYKELRQQIANLQTEQKQYIVKDELWSFYLAHGGTGLNASTGNDRTRYYISLPKNKLELWAFMESDRLENIILREFYSERDVVMEERRLRIENSPKGRLIEAVNSTAFWASPYKWSVIGWMSDLERISREDVEKYFRIHYSPANAAAVIVGDVDAEEVFEICEKYFGRIPPQELPPPVVTRDAEQLGERRVEVEFDANPAGYIAWNAPQIGHPDLQVLKVAANILSSGRTSRFHKNIKETKLGTVKASVDEKRYPGLFDCEIKPMGNHTFTELEEAVYSEIERLKTEPVSDWELQKVKNRINAAFVKGLNSNMRMARQIASSKVVTGDWGYFLKSYDAINNVTADDVMRVANKYFTKNNRTVVYLVKPETEDKLAEKEEGSK